MEGKGRGREREREIASPISYLSIDSCNEGNESKREKKKVFLEERGNSFSSLSLRCNYRVI